MHCCTGHFPKASSNIGRATRASAVPAPVFKSHNFHGRKTKVASAPVVCSVCKQIMYEKTEKVAKLSKSGMVRG